MKSAGRFRLILLVGLCMALAACRRVETAEEAGAPDVKPPKVVLRSPFAGSWYPAEAAQLERDVQGYLDGAKGPLLEDVQGLILPHAGYRFSGAMAGAGVRQVAGRTFKRVIVMGPTHRVPLTGKACLPDYTHYATPLGELEVDGDCVAALRKFDCFETRPGVHADEHSFQMEIPLLQRALPPFRLVPLVVGQLDEAAVLRMANALGSVVDDDTLVVVSSDFTHFGPNYGYEPFEREVEAGIRQLDMRAVAALEQKDFRAFSRFCEETGATICGRNPIAVLLAMLGPGQQVSQVGYDTSGRMTGDFRNSVSYVAAAVTGKWEPTSVSAGTAPGASGLDEAGRRRLLQLARGTLQFFYDKGRTPEFDELGIQLTPAMRAERGVFVTLNKAHNLRGCIGEIFAVRPLHEAVMANVLNSALRDRRFRPVTVDELEDIELEISVLTPPALAKSYRDIEIGRHGVVLRKNSHAAVFLPQVAPEQGWGVEEMLGHLALKAGLAREAWREGARFELFEADVFREADR